MDVAIGVGRAIVENKGGIIFPMLNRGVIELFGFPCLQASRFAFCEIASHREICFWKCERVFKSFSHDIGPYNGVCRVLEGAENVQGGGQVKCSCGGGENDRVNFCRFRLRRRAGLFVGVG